MKAPNLGIVDNAGVQPWTGATEPLKAAAAQAGLHFSHANLAHAKDRAALFTEIDRALKLPEHFGHNWDALADVIEDRDWLGKTGRVIVFGGSAVYRREHPNDWATLEEIFAEACEFWKERHIAFWIFTA